MDTFSGKEVRVVYNHSQGTLLAEVPATCSVTLTAGNCRPGPGSQACHGFLLPAPAAMTGLLAASPAGWHSQPPRRRTAQPTGPRLVHLVAPR